MSKRKKTNVDPEENDDSDMSLVDIDFDFFGPDPEVDYLAIKRLATQLLSNDAEKFPVHDLADLILGQPLVGTAVKCDGKESDPYAFLTVLNMHVHQNRPFMQALIEYVLAKSTPDSNVHTTLQNLLGPTGLQSQNHVGFVFSERLINMPVQIKPPMFRMLNNEIQMALEENEPYTFTHLLFISRIYRLTPEEASEMYARAPQSKRAKGAAPPTDGGVFSFHPEDEVIRKFAVHTLDYSFTNTEPREKDSFGLDVGGRMMLLPADKLPQLIEALNEEFPPPS